MAALHVLRGSAPGAPPDAPGPCAGRKAAHHRCPLQSGPHAWPRDNAAPRRTRQPASDQGRVIRLPHRGQITAGTPTGYRHQFINRQPLGVGAAGAFRREISSDPRSRSEPGHRSVSAKALPQHRCCVTPQTSGDGDGLRADPATCQPCHLPAQTRARAFRAGSDREEATGGSGPLPPPGGRVTQWETAIQRGSASETKATPP